VVACDAWGGWYESSRRELQHPVTQRSNEGREAFFCGDDHAVYLRLQGSEYALPAVTKREQSVIAAE